VKGFASDNNRKTVFVEVAQMRFLDLGHAKNFCTKNLHVPLYLHQFAFFDTQRQQIVTKFIFDIALQYFPKKLTCVLEYMTFARYRSTNDTVEWYEVSWSKL